VRAIAAGLPDNPMLPAIGRVDCPVCGKGFVFDRRGELSEALHARCEPYVHEPPVEERDGLDIVIAGLAEELPGYAHKLTLERLSTLYRLNLSTDGSGEVVASAPDETSR